MSKIPYFVFVFLILFFAFSNVLTFAQTEPTPTVPAPVAPGDAIPAPYVPCDETRVGEFHSLRPYQASPCNPYLEDLAAFCGNNLYVGNYITITKTYVLGNEVYKLGENPIYPNPPLGDLTDSLCYYCDSSSAYSVCKAIPPPCIPEITCDELKCGECEENGETERCAFNIEGSSTVTASFKSSEFPIMGYTEPSSGNESEPYKVVNSVYTDEETVDHATKMNEYVSWYLNGVINRAEYPYLDPTLDCVGESTDRIGSCRHTKLDGEGELICLAEWPYPINLFTEPYEPIINLYTPDGKDVCTGDMYCCVLPKTLTQTTVNQAGSHAIVNYSGPIKKLYPFSLQNIDRINTTEDGYESDVNDAGIRHNQTAACQTGFDITIPLINIDIELGGVPVACSSELYMDKTRIGDYFDGHLPPIEDNKPYIGEDFTNWLIDYKEWRGNACASFLLDLPFIGEYTFYLCYDSPLSANFWGNLFPYVPFSSTEDRLGKVGISDEGASMYSSSPNVNIITSEIDVTQDAYMFVPHMEESNELGKLLQNTYAYKDADLTEISDNGYKESSPYCDYLYTRSNPGDDLFSGDSIASVNYVAEVTCEFLNWGGGNLCENLVGGVCVSLPDPERYLYADTSYGEYDCGSGMLCVVGETEEIDNDGTCIALGDPEYCVPNNFINPTLGTICEAKGGGACPGDNFICSLVSDGCVRDNKSEPDQSCINPVMVGLEVDTETPLMKKVWARLVAGSSGVFRKMFPQINTEDGGFPNIIDMPALTNAVYSSSDGIVMAGNPAYQTSGATASIYFPHLGGISEYFLSGIQTLLRPKGMGEDITFSDEANEVLLTGSCSGVAFSEIGIPPDVSTIGISTVTPLLSNLTEEHFFAYEAAEIETGVPCEVLAGIHHMEAENDITLDLQSGASLGTRTLTESAIEAALHLQDKVGITGNFTSFDQLVTALSRYNGGGNSNCQDEDSDATTLYCSYFSSCDSGSTSYCRCPSLYDPADASSCRITYGDGFHYLIPYGGTCPPPSEGYDDIYPVNYLVDQDMYLLYPLDCTQAEPSGVYSRPGAFTYSIVLYQSETK